MTLIRSSVDYRLNELTQVTGKHWAMNYHPDKGGEIIQPNGMEVHFETLNEALDVLSNIFEVIRSGDTKWCLQ